MLFSVVARKNPKGLYALPLEAEHLAAQGRACAAKNRTIFMLVLLAKVKLCLWAAGEPPGRSAASLTISRSTTAQDRTFTRQSSCSHRCYTDSKV
jgi:hypothetical protein